MYASLSIAISWLSLSLFIIIIIIIKGWVIHHAREIGVQVKPVKSASSGTSFWRFYNQPKSKIADNNSTVYLLDLLYAIEDLFLDVLCLSEGRPTSSITVGAHVTIHTSRLSRPVIYHLSIKGGEYTPVPLFFKSTT